MKKQQQTNKQTNKQTAKLMVSLASIFLQLCNGFLSLSYGRLIALQNDLWPYYKLLVELKHHQQTAELLQALFFLLHSPASLHFLWATQAAALQDSSH